VISSFVISSAARNFAVKTETLRVTAFEMTSVIKEEQP
jgi:hypothetical protein